MLSKFLIPLAASASTALAATPAGFEPGSETGLLVMFGSIAALDGAVVAKEGKFNIRPDIVEPRLKTELVTQTAPTLATQSKLDGTSFAVMMIDLDIPTNNPPQTNTLLHWMQTGLTQSSSAVSFNTTIGSVTGFVLSAPEDEDAFAPYFGPSPPARIPLSHKYTEVIVDTSEASDEGLAALREAAANRQGFNAQDILTSAGLEDKVVAGNFFNVTNPGPASDVTAPNSTTGGEGNGTNFQNPPSQDPSQAPIAGAAVGRRVSAPLLAMMMVGVAFLAL
ncbi:phosphatidylethanolamine-binding protein [Xylaria palmicola]|nr:phosphatidylethanolamine-binding protein [Xylaria palmicola]